MPAFVRHLPRRIVVLLILALLAGAGVTAFMKGAFGGETEVRSVSATSVAPAPELAKLPPEPKKPDKKPLAKDPAREPAKASKKMPEKKHSEPAFDAGALEKRLREIAARHYGRYGVAVFDPASGETAEVKADKLFFAASIGKLPALITLYKAADRGELDLDERISILPSDYLSGSGVLKDYPAGTAMSLRKCAFYLMNESDNTAWTMLTRYLGRERIQTEMDNIGAESTDYWVPNTTTPDDVLLMLRDIADPSFTSEAASGEMLASMTDTSLENRIPAGVPSDVRVAHKYGTFKTSFGDAGVVFFEEGGSEKRYFIVVLSDGTSESVARDAMREMAGAAHEAISGSSPEPTKDSGGSG